MSDQGRHCMLIEISMENAVKMKTTYHKNPKNRNGLIQVVRMGKTTGQKKKKKKKGS